MWVSEEVCEECGRRRWDFLDVNFNRILDDFTTYFADICLLWGIGRRTEAQLDPDKPGFASQQHWWYRGSGLVFGEDGEDPEKSVMRGGKTIWIQTELVEGEMVKWVKGRLHRGLVLRCAKSIIQIWVNLSLFFSFHWRPHDMWVWAEVWEECGRRRWDFLHVNFKWF